MSGGRTVLLIEDDEDSRIILTALLTSAGYAVTEATNGEAGIEKARADRPDVILMDVSIPIIDGWEATRILKRDPDTAKIPILALTVHALPSDRAKAREVGCDDYISKPVAPRAVLAAIQRWIGPPEPASDRD